MLSGYVCRIFFIFIIAANCLAVERAPLRVDGQNQLTIARQLAQQNLAEHVVWLGEENEPFLLLVNQSLGATPQGAVLLFHDNGLTANWPEPIAKLQTLLPEQGWMTLSVSLPELSHSQFMGGQPSEASIEQLNQWQLDLIKRIGLVHDYAIDKGMFNTVWITQGQSSWWVGQYMLQKLNDVGVEGYHLVMLNADAPRANKMADIIRNLNIPILDVYQGFETASDDDAKLRKAAALSRKAGEFVQINESRVAHASAAYNDRLVRRIWGWIRSTAAGQQANLKVE